MSRLVMIAHDIGSKNLGMLFRPFALGKSLKALGHEVQMITATYSRVRRVNPQIDHDLQITIEEGMPYHWLKTPKFHGNSVKRALAMIFFGAKLWWRAAHFARQLRPDVVVASSPHPLVIFGAHRLAKRAKAKLAFEVRDIWPLSLQEIGGMSRWHPFYLLMQFAENYAYRHADTVISLLPHALAHMERKGLRPDKFFWSPNGYLKDEWSERRSLNLATHSQIDKFQKQYPILLGYAGAFGAANDLNILIQGMAHVQNPQVGLVLLGDGAEKEKLELLARDLQLSERILFLAPVAKLEIPDFLGYLTLAYIGLKDSPLFRFGVSPNKLVDYMMAGKPVVYAIDSVGDPVERSGCGWRVLPIEPVNLAKWIDTAAATPKNELGKMGEKGREWILQNLAYEEIAKNFAKRFQLTDS